MKEVLIIGIDGLSYAEFQSQQFSFPLLFDSCPSHLTTKSFCLYPPVSEPNWSAMFYGVSPTEMGYYDDLDVYPEYPFPYKNVFQMEGVETAVYAHWKPMFSLIGEENIYKKFCPIIHDEYDLEDFKRADVEIVEEYLKQPTNLKNSLTFLHLDSIDEAGHLFGYGDLFTSTCKQMDALVCRLLNHFFSEDGHSKYCFIVSDHGRDIKQNGLFHNNFEENTMTVPLFALSNRPCHFREKYVTNIDLTSTLYQIFETPCPEYCRSRSLIR
jgi:hypothetical protein